MSPAFQVQTPAETHEPPAAAPSPRPEVTPEPASPPPKRRSRGRVPAAAIESFTRNLKLQLESGVPLLRALRSQTSQEANAQLVETIDVLVVSIEGGASFAESLAQFPEVFPPVFRNMVTAGEASGTLERILGDLATYLAWVEDVKKTVRKALRYPVMVVSATVLLIMFILGWVMPKFEPLFSRMGDDLPAATKALLSIGGFISAQWPLLVVGLLGIGLGFWLLRRSAMGRRLTIEAVASLPLFGGVLRAIDMARVTRNLAILSAAGIPLIQALELSRDAVTSPSLSDAVDEIHDGLLHGEGFSQALQSSGEFPQMVVNMIGVGEEAGRLPDVLERLAEHYDEESRETVAKSIQFLEPMMTLTLGVVVAGIAASVLTTLYKVMMVVGR